MSDLSAYRGRVVRSRPRRSVGPIAVVAALAASFGVGALISHFSRQEPDFFASAYALRLPDMKPAAGMSATPALHEPLVFGRCYSKLRVNCVVDGDTLWMDGQKIRVADIDTPELGKPGCHYEKALGEKAMRRFIQLVNAGPFELRTWPGRDTDQYGRKLRVLVRDGRSLGDILVSEGLARTWTGRRMPWC
ncbi:MAG: nuclease [Rhizobiales bacterium]|nr:nuclease [Hyphomicrobiales bacterium]MBA69845.1 nuclease [Hyphomicrobiales bacterium]|tara:strand:+ start:172 stop:744 length:573 start_codon:yes stop_codon:yes gene_type:complete